MPLGIDIEPAEEEWERWGYGVILPVPIAGLALLWIISRHADLHDKEKIVLHGTDAVILGLTALCLALALHFHFFWGSSRNQTLRRYWLVGKTLSLLGLMIGLVAVTWRLARLFLS